MRVDRHVGRRKRELDLPVLIGWDFAKGDEQR